MNAHVGTSRPQADVFSVCDEGQKVLATPLLLREKKRPIEVPVFVAPLATAIAACDAALPT
jgi:hypothetical protein